MPIIPCVADALVGDLVVEAERLLPALHDFITRAEQRLGELSDWAWSVESDALGTDGWELGELRYASTSAHDLERALCVLSVLGRQVLDGCPATDWWAAECFERFGLVLTGAVR